MDSKPDLEKLFPSFQYFPSGCHAVGVLTAAQNIAVCIETLDDVSVDMGNAIFKSVQSCMQGNCPINGKNCAGQQLFDIPIKISMREDSEPNFVEWHSKKLARYFAERSFEKS